MRQTVYLVKDSIVNTQKVLEGEEPKHEWKENGSFKGEWKNGKKNGYGVQTWQNGSKYEGDWIDGKQHGHGVLWNIYSSKIFKSYSGSWKNGLKEGMGVHFSKNGERYEGQWIADKRNGHGSYFWKDGGVYVGEWLDDSMSGFGTMTKGNGDIYEGEWLNGKREGPGIFYFKAMEKIYDAEWINDIAKCGVYMDAADFFLVAQKSSSRGQTRLSAHAQRLEEDLPLEQRQHPRSGVRIPELRLADPESLLTIEIRTWQAKRQSVRNLPFLVPEMLFSSVALQEMRRIFDQAKASPLSVEAFAALDRLVDGTSKRDCLPVSLLASLFAQLDASWKLSQAELTLILEDLGKRLFEKDSAAPRKLVTGDCYFLTFSELVKAVYRFNQIRSPEENEIGDDVPSELE